MRRSKVCLSSNLIRDLMPGPRNYCIWDRDCPGFGVQVTPAGSRILVVKTCREGRRTWHTLGHFPGTTLEAARLDAFRIKDEVRRGAEPSATVRELQEAPTVADLAKRFLAEHVLPRRRTSTRRDYESILRRHVLPRLGGLRVRDLGREEAESFHQSLRSVPVRANRALAVLSKMMSLAESWGWRERGSNPCHGLERNAEAPRQRILAPGELSALGRALWVAEEEGINRHGLAAIRLLLHTGCRLGEILNLTWDQVDTQERCLKLPTREADRVRVVPLSAPALAVLGGVPRLLGCPFVAAGRVPGRPLADLKRIWARVCHIAGLRDIRIDDLRNSYAAMAAGSALGPTQEELLGGRACTRLEQQRCAPAVPEPLREASERVGRQIDYVLSWQN